MTQPNGAGAVAHASRGVDDRNTPRRDARFPFQPCGPKCRKLRMGSRRNPELLTLVARGGFEPPTFGL